MLFPNPSSSFITISIPSTQNSQSNIQIYNAEGILVYEKKNVTDQNLSVDVSQFATGIYFVKINSDKNVYMKKFVRE